MPLKATRSLACIPVRIANLGSLQTGRLGRSEARGKAQAQALPALVVYARLLPVLHWCKWTLN